jgi:magnesium transporter
VAAGADSRIPSVRPSQRAGTSLAPRGDGPSCDIHCVEFDFQAKTEGVLVPGAVGASIKKGRFVWIDVTWNDVVDARTKLSALGLIAEEIIDDALGGETATRIGRFDQYIHLVVTGCKLSGFHFDLERVDVVIAEHFLMTIHAGAPAFIEGVKKSYRADFLRFAKSPSFLLYEIWDHLLENYLAVQNSFERRVESLQSQLIGDVDDRVFSQISELGADLLHFRKVLLPARTVLTDLSTRKSIFISEATQPFLGNMVGTVEHVLQELLVDRDILSESLNLYMSMVGHRTNKVMNRLTVVSVVFLPLTFLCGVYGMNFEVLPELKWEHGYALFWLTALTIVAGLLFLMRRMKLL